MRFVDVKRIALYYKAIPGMLHLLRQERAELEEEYNGLGSTAADGTPHGSSPGKPTEELGLRALENGTGERLAQDRGTGAGAAGGSGRDPGLSGRAEQ